jgi:hypothetical protein
MESKKCKKCGRILMDLKDIGWEVVDWIYLPQDTDQWNWLIGWLFS